MSTMNTLAKMKAMERVEKLLAKRLKELREMCDEALNAGLEFFEEDDGAQVQVPIVVSTREATTTKHYKLRFENLFEKLAKVCMVVAKLPNETTQDEGDDDDDNNKCSACQEENAMYVPSLKVCAGEPMFDVLVKVIYAFFTQKSMGNKAIDKLPTPYSVEQLKAKVNGLRFPLLGYFRAFCLLKHNKQHAAALKNGNAMEEELSIEEHGSESESLVTRLLKKQEQEAKEKKKKKQPKKKKVVTSIDDDDGEASMSMGLVSGKTLVVPASTTASSMTSSTTKKKKEKKNDVEGGSGESEEEEEKKEKKEKKKKKGSVVGAKRKRHEEEDVKKIKKEEGADVDDEATTVEGDDDDDDDSRVKRLKVSDSVEARGLRKLALVH